MSSPSAGSKVVTVTVGKPLGKGCETRSSLIPVVLARKLLKDWQIRWSILRRFDGYSIDQVGRSSMI